MPGLRIVRHQKRRFEKCRWTREAYSSLESALAIFALELCCVEACEGVLSIELSTPPTLVGIHRYAQKCDVFFGRSRLYMCISYSLPKFAEAGRISRPYTGPYTMKGQ